MSVFSMECSLYKSAPKSSLLTCCVYDQLPSVEWFLFVPHGSPRAQGEKLLFTAGEIAAQGGRLLWLKSPRSPTPTPEPFQHPRHHTAHSSFYLNSKYGARREGCGAPRGQQSNQLPSAASLSFPVRARTARGGKSHMLTSSWICSLGKTAELVGVWATGHLADWPSLMWGSWDQRILGYQTRGPGGENYIQFC